MSASGTTTDPDSFSEQWPPPPTDVDAESPPRRRHRLLVTLGILGGLAILGFGVLLIVGLGVDQVLTHDLVDTKFEDSAEPFQVGSTSEFRFTQSPGAYRITARPTYESGTSSPAVSWGWFPRTAYSVDATATVGELDRPRDTVGVGCSGPKPTSGSDDVPEFFAFVVGGGRAALIHGDPGATTTAEQRDNVLDETRDAPKIGPDSRITLSCRDDLVGKAVHLTGRVDGEVVLKATHVHAGATGFPAMVLVYWPAGAGHSVSFRAVTAHVPE